MAAIKHFAQINGTSALKEESSHSRSTNQGFAVAPSLHFSHTRAAQNTAAGTPSCSLRESCINAVMQTDVARDLRYGTARGLMPRNATPTWKVVSACAVYSVIAVLAIVIGI